MSLVAERLQEKKYPEHIINNARMRALQWNQKECLKVKEKGEKKQEIKNKDYKLSFVTRYSDNAKEIQHVFRKNWDISKWSSFGKRTRIKAYNDT